MPLDRPLSQGPFIEDPTDEDYARAARAALSAKDTMLALQQAAAAASLRPLHTAHVELLDEVIAATQGPLKALEMKPGGTFFGLVAARARALARLHRVGDAVDCLFQAATFSPRTPFLPWAVPWVAHARDARSVEPRALAIAIVRLVEAGGVATNLEAAEVIAAKVQAAAGDAGGVLVVARSRILRALGRPDEALALLAGHTDWGSLVERGAVHRQRNELEERIRCFEEASVQRPHDVATRLDLADAYLDDARLDDAASAYAKALSLEPSQAWATSSVAYVRFLASGQAMALSASDDVRGRSLLLDAATYVTRLGDPLDPVVRVLRSVEQAPAGPAGRPLRVRVRAERPLAPSARSTFDLLLSRLRRQGALEVAQEVPREARPGPLWRLEAGICVPAVPRPPDDVLASVATIAATPFDWHAWRRAAVTRSPGTVGELLAAMVHLPAPVEGGDLVQHVHAFQIAAALRVALGPWTADARIEALSGLLAGVDDWTSIAAWLALRALADAAPELRPTIESRARSMVPEAREPLSLAARAIAVAGGELASGEARAPYLRLRARVLREIAETS